MFSSQQTRKRLILAADPVPPRTPPMAREPGVYNVVTDAKRGDKIGLAVTCPCGCRISKFFRYDPVSLFNDVTALEPPTIRHPVEFLPGHVYSLSDGIWYG